MESKDNPEDTSPRGDSSELNVINPEEERDTSRVNNPNGEQLLNNPEIADELPRFQGEAQREGLVVPQTVRPAVVAAGGGGTAVDAKQDTEPRQYTKPNIFPKEKSSFTTPPPTRKRRDPPSGGKRNRKRKTKHKKSTRRKRKISKKTKRF
jgi:hypothetical protein